ncbi:hypothetical protein Q7C36_000512 [Tachysurus vachellii]|uniref:Uncharacterized protein n=1 Tax=Tachysurus vachellii TaxID=175792 RepID=A0AA88TIW5_TACVA|nr:hypothetical protein Q7C36_000512 [Tachysurus vachellii]
MFSPAAVTISDRCSIRPEESPGTNLATFPSPTSPDMEQHHLTGFSEPEHCQVPRQEPVSHFNKNDTRPKERRNLLLRDSKEDQSQHLRCRSC